MPAGIPAAQASLGLVAPTLIAWHTQLRAAHKWLAQRRAEGGPGAAAAEQELRRSSYGWLAAPALRGARAVLGGIPVTCALAGLLAFVAALVWQQTP